VLVLFVSLSKLSVVLLVSVETAPCTDSVKELASSSDSLLDIMVKSSVGLCLISGQRKVVFITCLAS
jgi:hypothetical protein